MQDPEVTGSSHVTGSSDGIVTDFQAGRGSHSLSETTRFLGQISFSDNLAHRGSRGI